MDLGIRVRGFGLSWGWGFRGFRMTDLGDSRNHGFLGIL